MILKVFNRDYAALVTNNFFVVVPGYDNFDFQMSDVVFLEGHFGFARLNYKWQF